MIPTRTAAFPVHIRWAIRRDLPAILAIEQKTNLHPWDEARFLNELKDRHTIGLVAEHGEEIVGFLVYTFHRKFLDLTHFIVHPDHASSGVDHQLILKMVGKLNVHTRRHLKVKVRESDLAFQVFLRSEGFLARKVLRDHYDDTGEDAYVFLYSLSRDEDSL